MNAPNLSKADFSALLELAESKFVAWHLKEVRPEMQRLFKDRKNLLSGGRAMEIHRALLMRAVRQRISCYREVAHESKNPEMLSELRLKEFRDRIMTSIRAATGSLKGSIARTTRAAGGVQPSDQEFTQLQASILSVINAELRVLKAEGKLADPAGTKAGTNQASISGSLARMGAETAAEGSSRPNQARDSEPGGHQANRKDAEPPDRRAMVDAFILKCAAELSLKVNRKHIWRLAGHKTKRQFCFWQASDRKATAQDAQNFRRIVAMNPTDFEALLKKKGII